RDRAQPAPPAVRRPPRAARAGTGARSRGDRGGVSLRPRGSSRRARAARRAGLHPDAAASHEPGLGAPPPERPAYRLRAADGGQRGVVDRAVKRRDLPRHFRASAPARLDLAGGWTDVPPFSAREGGLVVNAAIELHAHAELKIGGKLFRLVSEDLGQELECAD